VKWICVVQDGDNLCAFVNTVVNSSFPQNGRGEEYVFYMSK